jgi:hypothetical protein
MLKIWIAVAILSVLACSKSDGESHNEDGSIKLFLGKLDVPMFDSISVHISAPDMNDIHISEISIRDNLKIDGIPYGENRQFEVEIYADSGKLVLRGDAAADIVQGETPLIPIALTALAGFLRLEVPLGIPNNTGIHSGIMSINGLEYRMKFEDGKGFFITNSLDLEEDFEIRVELYDSKGEILFQGDETIFISSFMQTATIKLYLTKGSAILELQAASEGQIQILAVLPADAFGSARTPKNFGDLFFTEIFADPAEGNDYQYMELYNPTFDTLQLKNCRIARNIGLVDGSGNRIKIDKDLILPPINYIILGRKDVDNANYSYGTYNLLKTSQSLGFFCGDFTIDSLTYSKSGDNIFPLAKGKAMQLPLANYKTRTRGSSWCFGASPGTDAICQ